MSTVGTVASTAAGIGLIAVAGRDVFDALFHPEGRNTLARGLMRATWHLMGARGRGGRLRALAGPVGLVLVVATWAALLITGWALIVLPHVPESFHYAPAVQPDHDVVEALNISLVTLTTLGFGDVVANDAWLRVVLPFEALLGFGLLSASISWLLLVHPALARRRSLAYEISLLRKAEDETGESLHELDAGAAEGFYAELTSRVVAVERDLVTFPVSYYFAARDERFSLPAVAGWLLEEAERGAGAGMPSRTRLRARLLIDALDDLAKTTSERFHGAQSDSTADLLAAYARDHGRG